MVEEDPCGLAQEPAAAQTFHQGPDGGCNVAEGFKVAFFLEEFRSLTPPTLTQTQVLH